MKPLDYTLYNKVKEKFPPQPCVVIFVSLAPENLEKLESVVFTIEQIGALREMAGAHADDAIPYAVIGGFEIEEACFHYASREFVQEIDLVSGEIVNSSIGIYNNDPVDIEDLKKEMRNFDAGALLMGNA
jgi:hypothetical protein